MNLSVFVSFNFLQFFYSNWSISVAMIRKSSVGSFMTPESSDGVIYDPNCLLCAVVIFVYCITVS